MTTPSSRRLGRRGFVQATGAAIVVALAGCGPVDDLRGAGASDASADEPRGASDDELFDAARADQERVLTQCLAVRRAHRPLAPMLRPIIDHHRTHVEILGGDPSATRPGNAAGNRTRALHRLRRLERSASRRRNDDATRVQSGEFARVLAAMAASHAQHAELLDQELSGRTPS